MTRRWRHLVGAATAVWLTVAVIGVLPSVAAPGQASSSAAAATRYRFWAYFHRLDATWTYATAGAGAVVPADGAVEGWRHELAADGAVVAPRAAASFARICAGVPAAPGSKRVGIVLDFGTAADAPPGQQPPGNSAACASGPADATTQQLTATVARLRFGRGGLICAIDGFPVTGCADPVAKPRPSASASPSPSPSARPTPSRSARLSPSPSARPTPTATPTRQSSPSAHPSPTFSTAAAHSPTASRSPALRERTTPAATSTAGPDSPPPSSPGSAAPSTPATPGPTSDPPLAFTGGTRPADPSSGPALGTWIGLGLLGVLALSGFAVNRHRRDSRQRTDE